MTLQQNAPEADAGRPAQRGFTTLELAVALGILLTFVLVSASALGLRPPAAHAAAIALEAALAEGRALAAGNGDVTDLASATGATVYVAPDPASPGHSVLSVYRSRPIQSPDEPGPGNPLPRDAGFPPQRVAAALSVRSGLVSSAAPFAILISSSGYASIAAPLGWDPGRSGAQLASDPGCTDGDVTIGADDGIRSERHPLSCRNASYDASR